MTLRAFIVGIVGIVIIGAICFFNDAVLYQNLLIGFHMPMSVFGMLVPAMLLFNPCLSLLHRTTGLKFLRPFNHKELCLIFALILPTCAIPYCSFMRLMPRAAMLPHHYAKTMPSWKILQEDGKTYKPATDYLPQQMLADPDVNNGDALNAMIQGLPKADGSLFLNPASIPWAAWKRPIMFWVPLFGLFWIALTGLAFVCHRQWSQNEHLPYPVVQFANSMFPTETGGISGLFRNKMFWVAMVFVFALHLNNFLFVYHTDKMIPVERVFNFTPLLKLFPTFMRGGGWILLFIRLYFCIIAIAYLLPTDVSFAVGLAPFIFYYCFGVMSNFGLTPRAGATYGARIDSGMLLGSYVGFFAILLYTGRHYYLSSLKGAFGFGNVQETGKSSIWGMRVFLLGFAVLMIDLCMLGLDWQIALLFLIISMICFLVLGRIIAETGMFYLSPGVYPGVLLIGIMGEQALGPTTMVILFSLTTLLFMDVRETYMPYIVNAVKFAENGGRKYFKYSTALLVAMIVMLAVSVPAAIYFSYDQGMNWRDGFATSTIPRESINSMLKARNNLLAQGNLELSESVKGFDRFSIMKPNQNFLIAFASTFIGVILFSVCRLHFPSWPLHPVVFCMWPNYCAYMTCWCFIIGGIIKVVVMKFGGSRCYQKLKPVMFGMIAGDMFSGLFIVATGMLYYFITGEAPKPYYVLPA